MCFSNFDDQTPTLALMLGSFPVSIKTLSVLKTVSVLKTLSELKTLSVLKTVSVLKPCQY